MWTNILIKKSQCTSGKIVTFELHEVSTDLGKQLISEKDFTLNLYKIFLVLATHNSTSNGNPPCFLEYVSKFSTWIPNMWLCTHVNKNIHAYIPKCLYGIISLVQRGPRYVLTVFLYFLSFMMTLKHGSVYFSLASYAGTSIAEYKKGRWGGAIISPQ